MEKRNILVLGTLIAIAAIVCVSAAAFYCASETPQALMVYSGAKPMDEIGTLFEQKYGVTVNSTGRCLYARGSDVHRKSERKRVC